MSEGAWNVRGSGPMVRAADTALARLSEPRDRGEIGAGVGAALTAALAADTLRCAALLSAGEWSDAAGAAAQAECLCARLSALADENLAAYNDARRALAGELGSARQDDRDLALGRALERAVVAPTLICETAADVAVLAEAMAVEAVARARPDVRAAVVLASGAAQAAAILVEVGLVSARTGLVERARAARERALESAARANRAGDP